MYKQGNISPPEQSDTYPKHNVALISKHKLKFAIRLLDWCHLAPEINAITSWGIHTLQWFGITLKKNAKG